MDWVGEMMAGLRGAWGERGYMEPFGSAEDAWFWTCQALLARQQGVRRDGGASVKRPCDPDDIILCVERLLCTGQIASHHARVLGAWGKQGVRPCQHYGGAQDQGVWSEAMATLGAALRKKGIVGGRVI